MAIQFFNEGAPMPKINKTQVRGWLKEVAVRHEKRVGEISYIFCDDEKIIEVNRQYLQHDYYTDIITFDYTEGNRIAGDVFVSLDTVKSNAEQFGESYETELYRVIAHGVLHLCGINDKEPGEREVMEQHENDALALLAEMQNKVEE